MFPSTAQKTTDNRQRRIVVGLDIGTTKICALVASTSEENVSINVLGIGITESSGSNRGVITHIEQTTTAIKRAVEQAEQQAGIEIKDVIVGIAGDHIQSTQNRVIVTISNPTNEISPADVKRVIEESRNMYLPAENEVLHLIPQEFIIDGQDGIVDPVGMVGIRMEANVHVVTGKKTAIQNIYRCCERIGLNVQEIVLEPIASSYAVLCNEEREVGVALIDIGGGTTDIAIFEDNIIRFTKVIAIAGKQVTDDVRKCLGIMASQAEKIKRDYGYTFVSSIFNDDVIMIPGIGGRKPTEINVSYLCQIIQPRMEEIFEFALSEIRRSGYAGRLGAGVVITGGCSLLKGTEELASEIFGMPVKIGMPTQINYTGLGPEVKNPIYSTAVGLALYGLQQAAGNAALYDQDVSSASQSDKEKKSVFKKVKKFFEDM